MSDWNIASIFPVGEDKPIWDAWLARNQLPALTVCDEAGVFEALGADALTLDELAEKKKLNPRALRIIFALVAAMGFVEKRMDRYRATASARKFLHPESPYYWGGLLSFFKETEGLHGKLLGKLKASDKPHFEPAFEGWKAGEVSDEIARSTAAIMHSHSVAAADAAALVAGLTGSSKVLDAGGGSGVFSIAFAKAWPGLQATVMELEAMCNAATGFIDKAGAADRVTTLARDMFNDDWPDGYNVVFFSNVFHDWGEERNEALAKKAFDALPPGGRIMLHEMLMNDNFDGPLTTASFGVSMLSGNEGRQYSLPEFAAILENAGFENVNSRPSGAYYSIIEATKPG